MPPSYFRHDQKLFASVSSLIFSLIRQFYRLAAGSPLLSTACAIGFQPFGDFLRANAHWHALVLEGGFTPDGKFLFLPIHDTQKLTEAFHRAPRGWKEAHGVTDSESTPQLSSPSVPESSYRSLGRRPFRQKRREPPGLDPSILN